jgi:hypothetical protein
MAGLVPMRRGAPRDEIAEATCWQCSGAPSYVSGAPLDFSGGRSTGVQQPPGSETTARFGAGPHDAIVAPGAYPGDKLRASGWTGYQQADTAEDCSAGRDTGPHGLDALESPAKR